MSDNVFKTINHVSQELRTRAQVCSGSSGLSACVCRACMPTWSGDYRIAQEGEVRRVESDQAQIDS